MGWRRTVKGRKSVRKDRSSSARDPTPKGLLLSQTTVKTSYHIGGGEMVIATEVFDTFWKFAAERKAIYDKRINGHDAPWVLQHIIARTTFTLLYSWTDDPILQAYRFCNTFRMTDATCQYIIRYVIRAGSQAPAELVFRVLLFDIFTRIGTWEFLLRNIGAPIWATYNRDDYARVLDQAKEEGMTLYTGSFQKPAPFYGHDSAFMNHLHALELLMEADLPGRLVAATSMADLFNWLRTFKGMGDFSAYQLLLNLSYTGLGQFSDAESFVVLGCGAHAGLKRCFRGELSRSMKVDLVRWMQRTQQDHFTRLGLSCTLGPPGSKHHVMSVCDIEHTLCEVDKVGHVLCHAQRGF